MIKHLLSIAVVMAMTTNSFASEKNIVETAVEAGSFKTLAAALTKADLLEVLQGDGPFTVFAPTDEAFAKLPAGTIESLLKPEAKATLQGILTYHVVSGKVPAAAVVKLKSATTVNGQRVDIRVGDKVMVDNATVVMTDIHCSNGIIHVIDAVILPEDKSIVGVAAAAGKFGTLIAAAKAAGLAGVLDKEGPFTVFAPTDEAFAKLPEGTVASLLKPENKSKLAEILKYHVVSGRVYSDAALKAKSAKTLQGASVHIGVIKGHAKANNANLIATDIDAANGVIHIVDQVLLPSQEAPKKQEVKVNSCPLQKVAVRKRR